MTTVSCTINGERVEVPAGRTVAAAMILEGSSPELRRTRIENAPRGVFCGIGVCFDCLVFVNGQGPLRSCLVEVEPGMEITSGGEQDA